MNSSRDARAFCFPSSRDLKLPVPRWLSTRLTQGTMNRAHCPRAMSGGVKHYLLYKYLILVLEPGTWIGDDIASSTCRALVGSILGESNGVPLRLQSRVGANFPMERGVPRICCVFKWKTGMRHNLCNGRMGCVGTIATRAPAVTQCCVGVPLVWLTICRTQKQCFRR